MTNREQVAPLVFGHMVHLVQPHMIAYHSDLYLDALWIREQLTADRTRVTFRWSYRDTGTAIGDHQGRRTFAYLFTVWVEAATGYLTVEEQP